MAAKAKLSQQELRKLMKEKQGTFQDKKVASPLAKYNNLNELVCVLCNIKIRNELLWTAHVNGRNHRENLSRLKKKKEENEIKDVPAKGQPLVGKRKLSDGEDPLEKKSRVIASKEEKQSAHKEKEPAPIGSQPRRGVIINYDEMDEDEDKEEEVEANDSDKKSTEQPKDGELPTDFFDNPGEKPDAKSSADPKIANKKGPQSTKALPQGFFDDPVMDAKVRKVEYKNPLDDEWEKFQKAIAEENTVSQALLDVNDEESKAERQIDEIDEQIHNWARVEALQQRKEVMKKTEELSTMNVDEEDGSNEDADYDEFLNWRSKGTPQLRH